MPVVVGAVAAEGARAAAHRRDPRAGRRRPRGCAPTLRDYQLHGLTWLADMTSLGLGACLADDMGLGKTVTLIALHLHRSRPARPGRPWSSARRAARQLGGRDRRFAPGVPVRRFHGGRATSTASTAGSCSPPTARCGGPRGARRGRAGTWSSPTRPSTSRTPLLDREGAAHDPERGPGRADRHPGREQPHRAVGDPRLGDAGAARQPQRVPQGVGGADRVRAASRARPRSSPELVGPFLLRRRKSDPGIAPELPPKTETDHPLASPASRWCSTRRSCATRWPRIERADEETRRGLVLALLTGLKQICNHPAHFLKQSGGRLAGRSGKLDLLDELLGTVLAEDGAVLVFTQYVAMARLLEAHLAARRRPPPVPARRHPGPRARGDGARGSRPASVPVFLLSLKAGGTGLNLTRADHVVHFDRWWNPAVEEQATDRAYRIGQTRPVQVHRLITARHHRGADRRAARPASARWPTPCSAAARPRSPS